MLLRKICKEDYEKLYEMVVEPTILRYVRYKPTSLEHYLAIMDEFIQMEMNGECISRTIIVDNEPIGTITLFDIKNKEGFLATWIGVDYQGKGYNQLAKELFFKECYVDNQIERIYMKIRKENQKSQNAAKKLQYVEYALPILYSNAYTDIDENIFEVYFVNKQIFLESIQYEDDKTLINTIQYLLEHSLFEDIELLFNKLNLSNKNIDFFKNNNYNI